MIKQGEVTNKDLSIKLQRVSEGFYLAKPYYKDMTNNYLSDSNNPVIWNICSLRELINALIEELKNVNKEWKDHPWCLVKHNLDYGIYFRGESNCKYELRPSIGRMKEGLGIPNYDIAQERDVLHRFRRQAYSRYQRVLTDWETIFLARHHELPTRLLDWSSNYLVALYWACASRPTVDGAIYSFVRQPEENWDLNVFNTPLFNSNEYQFAKDFKFLVKGVKIIYPFHVSSRITAHGGLFTIQNDPWVSLTDDNTYSYEFNICRRREFDIFHIRKWKVPWIAKQDILKELDEVGINKSKLYLDLDSLAKTITDTEAMRWMD
jgi:hypothetical protein